MIISRIIASLVGLSAIAACATQGTETEFKNSAVVARAEPAVWDGLIQYVTSNGIQIKTIARDSGIIYAESLDISGHYASCDEDPGYPTVRRIAQLNVFVRKVSGSQTQITVNANYMASGKNPYMSERVDFLCYSTGLLEQEILFAAGAHPQDIR